MAAKSIGKGRANVPGQITAYSIWFCVDRVREGAGEGLNKGERGEAGQLQLAHALGLLWQPANT